MPARWREALDAVVDVLLPPACAACDEVLPGPVALCEDCAVEVLELPDDALRGVQRAGRSFLVARLPPVPGRRAFRAGLRAVRARRVDGPGDPPLQVRRSLGAGKAAGPPAGERLGGGGGEDAGHAGAPAAAPRALPERRYDQAALLAAELSQRLGRPLEVEWLTRVRDTRRQVGLSEAEREANVAGAFAAPPQVRGQDVVLVDDVFTSGASAREAAGALRAAGASRVFVLTLARARSLLRSAGV